MPFLAERRVVAVRGCERLRAQPRRDLWAVAEAVPAGNTLMLEDLFPPKRRRSPTVRRAGRPQGVAHRHDRQPRHARRFVRETLDVSDVQGGAARDRGDGRERSRPGRDRQRPREARAERERRSPWPTSSARAWRSRTPRRGTTPARWSKAARPMRWRSPSSSLPATRAGRASAGQRAGHRLGLDLGTGPARRRRLAGAARWRDAHLRRWRGASASGARGTVTQRRCAVSKRSSPGGSTIHAR